MLLFFNLNSHLVSDHNKWINIFEVLLSNSKKTPDNLKYTQITFLRKAESFLKFI